LRKRIDSLALIGFVMNLGTTQFDFCHYPAVPPPVSVRLITTPPHACPYFAERLATNRVFYSSQMTGEIYHRFMDSTFRRSGNIFYQPVCQDCRKCMPIRIPLARFVPSKSQRRCWRRNQDLTIHCDAPRATDEKFALYSRYLKRHGKDEPEEATSFVDFLYQSPIDTVEFTYRDGTGRLLAVGICDVCPTALSSVYFYFDPADSRRGLGTFGVLKEIEYATQADMAHYYLGYWVEGSRTMDYKANFQPYELLHPDGQWR
jgi:arginine-tRNA-protein transferase